jgi:hypothetical protein
LINEVENEKLTLEENKISKEDLPIIKEKVATLHESPVEERAKRSDSKRRVFKKNIIKF